MRLTLRQLQVFLAVCRAGSTAAAGDAIGLSQSATSAALNELEGALNVKLFDRIGKRINLNDNGRLLVPQAMQMLDAATNMEQQFVTFARAERMHLRVGASTTIGNYLLPAILGRYGADGNAIYPNVMIANTADVARAVANFDVDVAFIEGPCHEPELQVEPWRQDEMIIVCAANDPMIKGRRGSKVPIKALRDAGWILREPGSGTREAVEHLLMPHLHHLQAAGEFSSAEAIKRAVVEGLGIACLSRDVVHDLLALGQLKEVRTTLPKLTRHFYLIYSKRKVLSNRLGDFLQYCRDWKK
jgi:DNA-binding transcriptional LysR family regulator